MARTMCCKCSGRTRGRARQRPAVGFMSLNPSDQHVGGQHIIVAPFVYIQVFSLYNVDRVRIGRPRLKEDKKGLRIRKTRSPTIGRFALGGSGPQMT